MIGKMTEILKKELSSIEESGLSMDEWVVYSPQGGKIKVQSGEVLNFCTNNYLGLANHPILIEAAKKSLDQWGYGLSAGRLLTGTMEIHKNLEKKLSDFVGMEASILYSSCFDANGGLFEALLSEEDAIISDQLNHASIIDGIRLCKAERYRYAHADMEELEEHLKTTRTKRFRLISTDGVFSMDGDIAKLKQICDLADKYDALVMVDDSHATGFIGNEGRGTHEFCSVMGRIDVLTSTLGKALGGASGGFTSGRKEIIDFLRQKSRPYIFSNSLSPAVVFTSLVCLDLLKESGNLRKKLMDNTRYFREKIKSAGFDIKPGDHPIVPVMIGDAPMARRIARDLLPEGVFAIAMGFPIVPKGQARIRVINSAAHEKEDIDFAVDKFAKIGKKHGAI